MAKDQVTTVKDAVHKVQLALLEGIGEQNQLFAAGSLMSRSDYQDVVTERTIAGVCGFPLCGNPLPSERPRKGRYRISLKEHKVYDLQETYMYCSTNCVINSHTFAATLSAERCPVFNSARVNEILSLFKDQSFETIEVQNLGKNGDLGLSELKIQEKTETKGGEVSPEDWIGPSNAIEGYVPKRDQNVKPLPSKSYKNDFASDDAQLNEAQSVATKDKEFEDKTLSAGQSAASRTLPSKSDASLSFELLSSDAAKSSPSKKESNSTIKTKDKASGSRKTLKKGDSLQSNKSNQGHKPKRSNQKKDTDFFSMDFMSTIITQDEYSVSKPPSVGSKIGPAKPTADSELSHESPGGSSSCASIAVPHSGRADDSNRTVTRSSIKSSGRKKGGRTVTWADENNTSSGGKDLCEIRELKNTEGTSGILSSAELEENDMPRLASAKACATALSQAAEAIASGQTEADAVSGAGVLLLAQAPDAAKNEGACETDAAEVEQAPLKWQKKSGISSTDVFDSPDSWFDLPPEGFSLTLSPFATMWNALFSWMTCSSLAYIYGKDDSLHEEFLHTNGREYPGKVVLSGGRSSEIKETMAGCLARAMPSVVEGLKLGTPLSTLEQGLTRLLETMSFTEALPPFRAKQWQVIVLLFLEALSVSRINGLATHLSSKRTLILKVVDGAQMKMEDYEFLKDIVIPLGPQP